VQLDEGAKALAVARLEVSLDVEEGNLAKFGCTVNSPTVKHTSCRDWRNQAGKWSTPLVVSSFSPSKSNH
jgi:hypothetical protein